MTLRLLAGFAFALMFCGPRESTHDGTAKRDREMIPVQVSHKSNMGFAPLYIAEDEGYFKEEGIDLKLAELDASSALVAFTAGRVDVLATPLRSGIFNIMGRGVTAQIVAERGHSDPAQCSAEAFVAPAAAAERIARRGLKGEKVALLRGGAMEYMIDLLLAQQNLTRADVEFVQISPNEMPLSERPTVEAIRLVHEPQLSHLVASGKSRVVATMEQVSPGQQLGFIVYGPRMLRDEDLGARFMRAYLRGVRRYREGKTDGNVAIISRYTKLPAEMIRQACWQTIAHDGMIDPKSLEPFLVWAREHDYLEPGMPPENWWNPRFVESANRDLDLRSRR